MARPTTTPRSRSRRSSELFAAFNDTGDRGLPGYDELNSAAGPAIAQSLSGTATSADARLSNEVFFDAGDALPEEQASSSTRAMRDPLTTNDTRNAGPAYDFERPEYFPSTTRRPPSLSNRNPMLYDPATQIVAGSVTDADESADLQPSHIHFDPADVSSHSNRGINNGYSRLSTSGDAHTTHSNELTRSDRIRFALGRFGSFVGMGIPGARYAALSQNAGHAGAGGRGVHRPRVVGGGIGQDGVFANLNAKPERRRRGQATDGSDDRGEDDDLEENVQPPTYEIAAADAVPQYWETTILGGGVHPLANGLGWTPGGAHVGAIEDLIVDGLPLGNFFGFAWNLLVSVTFQFVGFLLTYLLHTTHAARCGSRAGLGITLIQYGFYLRTRANEISEGKAGNDVVANNGALVGGGGWFDDSQDLNADVRRRSALPAADGGTPLADLFAAQADSVQASTGDQNFTDSMSQSTEWLAYVLMVLGWFIILSSMLSYWRIYRWGRSLVNAARRDQDNTEAATSGVQATMPLSTTDGDTSSTAPVGFISRLRSALSPGHRVTVARAGSGEDWLIFPGIGHRLGVARQAAAHRSRHSENFNYPTSIDDLEDMDDLDTHESLMASS